MGINVSGLFTSAMRSRGRDVDDFLKGVKELDERTQKEDQERLERLKSTAEREIQSQDDRFARMRAREDNLRQERDKRTRELQVQDKAIKFEEPPALPKRREEEPKVEEPVQPEPAKPEPTRPEPKPKGFVASAFRNAPHENSPEPTRLPTKHLSPESKPEKPKPSWISSAMTRSKPQLSEQTSERKPVGSGPPTPTRSRSTSPVRPLQPQNAGFDPKFVSKYRESPKQLPKPLPKLSPAVDSKPSLHSPLSKASPARKPVSNTSTPTKPSIRTPSQSLKDARSSLAKKPKPKMEDLIKEFREQLVLSPVPSPEKIEARKPVPKLPPRREPSVPEALRNRSLKPALPSRKTTPPSAEAIERMKSLRPAQKAERLAEETPEALERMKSLSKPPKLERAAEPESDAMKTLRSLRPSKSIEKKPPPSPEALDRLHSLRKAKPKPAAEEVVPEAFKKLENLKSRPQASKPSLQRSPNTNLRQTSSIVDFRTALSSAIEKGPSSDGSPLRRSKTDTLEPQQPLEHLTKSRPRGPKRKLPSAAKGASKTNDKLRSSALKNELDIPKRNAVKHAGAKAPTDRNFSREELKRLASAKRKPKLTT